MVVIRLTRAGRTKRPFYHIIATDKRSARDGRFIEQVGIYDPLAQEGQPRVTFTQARLEHWLTKGAQPSDTVSRLIKEAKRGTAETSVTGASKKPAPVQKATAKPKKAAAKTHPIADASAAEVTE